MRPRPLEGVHAVETRHRRRGQQADRRHQEARPIGFTAFQTHDPAAGVVVKMGGRDAGGELNVLPYVELVRDEIAIALDLRLAGEALAPIPFVKQLPRKGVAVGIAFGIEARARISISIPGAANVGPSFEDTNPETALTQPIKLVNAGNVGADNDRIEIQRLRRAS